MARSRSLLAPVVGGIVVLVALVLGIAFRSDLWKFLKWLGSSVWTWLTDWAPSHPAQTAVILGFGVLAFLINWLAHVRGRLRAWVFALVVEVGLWLLFWYGLGIPPLNELSGLNVTEMTNSGIVLAGAVMIAISGALFWFLEAREEFRKYRHSTSKD